MVITSSGCVTTKHYSETIESDSIQEFIDNPSEISLPFKTGDTIGFETKETIILHSVKVDWVKMVVMDINTVRIRGELVALANHKTLTIVDLTEGVEENVVEVKLEDIESIRARYSETHLSEATRGAIKHGHRTGDLYFLGVLLLLLLGMIFQG
jgi:hypothetical protein